MTHVDADPTRSLPAQSIAYPSGRGRPRRDRSECAPHVVVLFGATGDLSRRKLLCGLAYLAVSGLTGGLRVIGTSLDELSEEQFRQFARDSIELVGNRKLTPEQWDQFAPLLSYVPSSAGPAALEAKVREAELGEGVRLLHYLSVPPRAATAVITMLDQAGLVDRSRVVMEKPFGEDLESAIALNAEVHKTFEEEQIWPPLCRGSGRCGTHRRSSSTPRARGGRTRSIT